MDSKLSINTDFKESTGYPFWNFSKIADAGFTHIHWCHQWNTDFQYNESEIAEIKKQLNIYNLSLSDTHASSGVEKCWYSPIEYQRVAGVDLLKNRIFMTSVLGGDAIVLHPFIVNDRKILKKYREQGLKSLEEVESFASSCYVKIALENLYKADNSKINDTELENIDTLEFYFKRLSPETFRFCWDIGHSIILGERSIERCAKIAKERLSVLHLNDNRGDYDQHSTPFSWFDRWEWIAETVASSPYPVDKPEVIEVDINRNPSSVEEFLNKNLEAGIRFHKLFMNYRNNNS